MFPVVFLYLGGTLVGLFCTDARPAGRIALALLWPLGPLAFLVTTTILVVAAAIAFPLVGLAGAALGAAAWWVLR